MITFLIMFIISFFIPLIMFIFSTTFSKKMLMNHEKKTPFECGFDPMTPNRYPFSVQFFLISIIFLIFDIEIILLIPFIKLTLKFSFLPILMILTFIMILIIGLYFEYFEKSMNWKL